MKHRAEGSGAAAPGRARAIFTGLSLLLCALVTFAWIRSFFTGDRFYSSRFTEQGTWTYWVQDLMVVGRGGVVFEHIVHAGRTNGDARRRIEEQFAEFLESPMHQTEAPAYPREIGAGLEWPRVGIGLRYDRSRPWPGDGAVKIFTIVLPLWIPVLLSVPLPVRWAWARGLQARRARLGRCRSCGYDVRATPDRCPECGAWNR